jgi:aryl-alcohol dehydrogenase-like predicted oxidoreductase
MGKTMRPLVLGSAQFGNGYGYYVKTPQISTEKIDEILRFALDCGVTELDLAQNYVGAKSNLSEQETLRDFRLGTKVEYLPDTESEISKKLDSDITELGVDMFESILVHNWAQLKNNERKQSLLYLTDLRRWGITKQIGISVYETDELQNIDTELDIVQAPLSFFNTDFLQNQETIALKHLGVIFVARSVFHQGTLLNPSVLPEIFRAEKDAYESFCIKNDYSYLQAALSIFDAQDVFTKLVIGVADSKQLAEIVDCEVKSNSSVRGEIPSHFPRQLADPRKWAIN